MTNLPDQRGIVPNGVAHVAIGDVGGAQSVVFVLLPQFSMSAFSSAIEPLRIANQLTSKPLFYWTILSEDGDPVMASNGIMVCVDGALGDTEREAQIFVCSGVEPQKTTSSVVANWLRLQWRTGRIVGGLCTGAYALAKAGILQNVRFTLHWENIAAFREIYPDLDPIEQLYTQDGRIMTCGGGSAATDMFVKLIRDTYGHFLAQGVLNMCLVPFHRDATDKQTASQSARIGTRNQKLSDIMTFFEDNIEEDIDLDHVGQRVGISRRQMERLFKRYTDNTPRKILSDMRLQRGRSLLAETNLSVAEVAAASGFASASHFSKKFRDKFGHSPHRFMM